MVGFGAAPAVLQFGLLVVLPETPRWLVKNGDTQLARIVLGKVYGRIGSAAEEVFQAIGKEISEEEAVSKLTYISPRGAGSWTWYNQLQNSLSELLGIGGNRRALIIACLLQGLQQLCGFVLHNILEIIWQH